MKTVNLDMSIYELAKMKNIPMETIVKVFEEHGFLLEGADMLMDEKDEKTSVSELQEERIELLKGYLRRLSNGEDLEAVRRDFAERFQDVDASEIMKAEQEILREGTPLNEVQKLCDVHSALFHGKTGEEKIANAEKTVNASLIREQRAAKTKQLSEEKGHPLYTFTKENEALETLLKDAKVAIGEGRADQKLVDDIRGIAIHYAKKGDLLYPHLKVAYGISGPSDVMWTVDDEIRDELSALSKLSVRDKNRLQRLEAVLKRAEEMIYKEKNILFPNCAVNFSEEEWMGIYHDAKDYAECLGVKQEIWEAAEENKKNKVTFSSDREIVMAGGHMTVPQLTALLNTIPLEITFVDAENINRFFNEGPKDFKRPGMAIDREVFSCHPPKVEAQVRHIINELRAGTLDEVPIWMEKNGKCMLVKYMAVRDKDKNYLGTVELVQNMEFAREYFLSKKGNSMSL